MTWQMLEGVLSNAVNAGGANGSHVDFNALEGARVEIVSSNAEMPRSGMLIDAVMKSGGNDFHGAAVVYGSGPALEADNINDSLKAAGIIALSCTRSPTCPARSADASSATSSGFLAARAMRGPHVRFWMRTTPTARRSWVSGRLSITSPRSRIRCRPRIGSPASIT